MLKTANDEIREVRSVCPYCGVGCGLLLRVKEDKLIGVKGDREHPANFGRLCTKGLTSDIPVHAPDRLIQAQVRTDRSTNFSPLDTASAHQLIARRLQEIISREGPDSFAFYLSGQMSTESQYVANKLAKGFLRTNNVDSNSRLCMSSAASGYRASLGADAPPGSYSDFESAECFLVIGANMADCHPILFLRLLDRKKESGARLIVVDPRRTATADKADLYLPIRPGTDLAFLHGLLHLLEKEGHLDLDFISHHTQGWSELHNNLVHYPPERVAEITGLRVADLRLAARCFGQAKEAMTLWTMGLNQSTHGTAQTSAICNLHLATGKILRPGSGPFSLTGQPNAMGGREVGYLSAGLPGQRLVTKPQDRAFIEALWQIPPGSIGAKPGLDAVSLFQKMEQGKLKAVWIICTNPVASMPNRARVIAGLAKAELVIVQDAFHPTETSKYADILLPGALWAEAEGTMVNSERQVTLMQAAICPPGESLPDWKHLTEVARLMGHEKAFAFESASAIFDEIRKTHNPDSGYDLRGISYKRLRQGPLQWPCSSITQSGARIRYRGKSKASIRFATDSGRAQFCLSDYLPPEELPDEDYPFVLNTGRLPHHWHTLTKTAKVPALIKLHAKPFLELHPVDAARLGVVKNDWICVSSRRGRFMYPVAITERIRVGCCFAPFHWNDLYGQDWTVNAVTSEAKDVFSLQPELKYCAVRLEKVERSPSEVLEGFTPEQSDFLREFFSNLSVPPVWGELPGSAPFTEAQRLSIQSMGKEGIGLGPPSKSRPVKGRRSTELKRQHAP